MKFLRGVGDEMELFLLAVGCFGLGILTLLFPHGLQRAAHWLANSACLAGSALVAYAAALLLFGGVNPAPLSWGPYSLTCDGWSAVFLLLTGIAGVITSLYALGYARAYEGSRLRMLGGMWSLFLVSMVLVLLAGDAFSFLLFWEIMAVASFMLVNHESEKRSTWTAAYQYLVMTSVGTAAIMIAFLLTGVASASFSFADMAKNTLTGVWQHAVFICAFAGFALKAGLVPLHVWLPKAHPAAPSHVSALMSGVMLKIALYGFGRFIFSFLPEWNYWWCVIVTLAGVVSAFLGVLYAQMETDIKRVLAYSSVENMGVIFAAVGCGMLLKEAGGDWYLLGFVAALVHAFNHSIMKVLMFMSAGSIMHGTGSKNLELFGGLARKMPYTAAFAFVGSMALAAIPLTNGFTGEWLVLQSFITLATNSVGQSTRLLTALSFILLGFTGALALGCFVRFFGITFLGRARSEAVEHAHESDGFMLTAMGIASVLVLAFGLYPVPVLQAASFALGVQPDFAADAMGLSWAGVGYKPVLLLVLLAVLSLVLWLAVKDSFVRKDVTWNCGTYPTQRQQYSATGFSKPVRRAFDYLLKPKRQVTYMRKDHAYFGRQLSYKLEIPDMITEKLYLPFQKHFVGISAFLRRLQQGSVRLYVAYVMAAMVLVLVWGALYK
ncbi:proton-conducting transporter membrane subunit [uncultured Phascolarctobacterium sp.]|uniref:proton-conducting transporter transmembrane domain-containing protein n=1 Tax=uncultured Phascolarctobacterium sp. TaxID=512296 RepID=UPI0025D50DA0|nr:proton-conducting transporter membrane subunit [uncultured Phascolarctobacterium sp.]